MKTVARPEPFASICLAATEHDNGWQDWEAAPSVDEKTFLPHTFMTIPTVEHISLYQRGIERVVRADLYAGMLVAGHCMSLYDRARATMPGYSAKYVRTHEQHDANDFVQRLRLQQLRLKVDLRANPAMKPFTDERVIKANQQWLDVLDRLSLYFCLGMAEDATIEGVPLNAEGEEADWQLRPQGNHQFSLDPYPFRRDPLEFSILARRIPRRRYTDDAELEKQLSSAHFFNMKFSLRSKETGGSAFAVSS